jgi:hypothetical protein
MKQAAPERDHIVLFFAVRGHARRPTLVGKCL